MGRCLDMDVVIDADGWDVIVSVDRVTAVGQAAYAAGTKGRKAIAAPICAVALSSDQAVRDLNRRFRDIDKPTNVLSFPSQPGPFVPSPLLPGPGTETHLGDVILALETVQREAVELAILPEHHALHLVAHGLLHLLGYEHDTDEGAGRMERLETAVLHGFGIADPYEEKEQPEPEAIESQRSPAERS